MAATKKRAHEGEADLASRNKNPRMDIDISAIQPRQSPFSAPGPAAGSRSLVSVIAVPTPTASPQPWDCGCHSQPASGEPGSIIPFAAGLNDWRVEQHKRSGKTRSVPSFVILWEPDVYPGAGGA